MSIFFHLHKLWITLCFLECSFSIWFYVCNTFFKIYYIFLKTEIKSESISSDKKPHILSQSTLVELKAFLRFTFLFVSFFINSENNMFWICCILSNLQSNLFSAISSCGWITELRDREIKILLLSPGKTQE